MKISVIVPVYNVAPYLRECLESIAVAIDKVERLQGCKVEKSGGGERWSVEVICVDDGSTDGSSEILDEFQRETKVLGEGGRVVVVHQANAGVALEIGDDVHLGADVMIYTNRGAKVAIGSHVDIAPRVVIETGGHEVDPVGEHIAGRGTCADVVVGDGCWIGVGSIVLAGVELRPKTLVAAGSVVVRSPQSGCCLVAGVPAEVKKSFG